MLYKHLCSTHYLLATNDKAVYKIKLQQYILKVLKTLSETSTENPHTTTTQSHPFQTKNLQSGEIDLRLYDLDKQCCRSSNKKVPVPAYCSHHLAVLWMDFELTLINKTRQSGVTRPAIHKKCALVPRRLIGGFRGWPLLMMLMLILMLMLTLMTETVCSGVRSRVCAYACVTACAQFCKLKANRTVRTKTRALSALCMFLFSGVFSCPLLFQNLYVCVCVCWVSGKVCATGSPRCMRNTRLCASQTAD